MPVVAVPLAFRCNTGEVSLCICLSAGPGECTRLAQEQSCSALLVPAEGQPDLSLSFSGGCHGDNRHPADLHFINSPSVQSALHPGSKVKSPITLQAKQACCRIKTNTDATAVWPRHYCHCHIQCSDPRYCIQYLWVHLFVAGKITFVRHKVGRFSSANGSFV